MTVERCRYCDCLEIDTKSPSWVRSDALTGAKIKEDGHSLLKETIGKNIGV